MDRNSLEFFPPGKPTFVAWQEPENRFFNAVIFFEEPARSSSIISDATPNSDLFIRVPDGARLDVPLTLPPSATDVFAAFHDVSDVGRVSDTGDQFYASFCLSNCSTQGNQRPLV